MINVSTYSDFYNHVRSNTGSTRIFYFVHLKDLNDNDYKYSNYQTHYQSYIPIRLINVNTAVQRANTFTGEYSISPISVRLENSPHPQANTTYSRFSQNFSGEEFETAIATIYLGYQGIEDDSGTLFPFYKGRIANWRYGFNTIDFDVIDRALLDLPDVPKSTFSLTNYPYIDKVLVGKPIPLVYGYWDNEALNTTKYGYWHCVPAYVVQDSISTATPQLILEVADHSLYAIGETFIFDDALNSLGAIQDTIADDTTNARVTITLGSPDYLTAIHYHDFNRLKSTSGTVTNTGNAIDNDFDTHATIETASTLQLNADFANPLSTADMEAIYAESTGIETTGIAQVTVDLSMYCASTPSQDQLVSLLVGGDGVWSESHTLGTTEPTDFNLTGTTKLQVCYPQKFDGSTTKIFLIQEADDASGTNATAEFDVIPDEGYYSTMSALAAEIEKQLQALTDGGSLVNSYTCIYEKARNRIVTTIQSGSKYFRCKTGGQSADINYGTTTYGNTSYDGQGGTILDVPDGDFSLLTLQITGNVGAGIDVYLKGVRLVIKRKYRDYNVSAPGVNIRRRGLIDFEIVPPAPRNRRNRSVSVGGRPISSSALRDRFGTQTVKDAIAGARFYVAVAGVPVAGEGYAKTGSTIIRDLLENQIGIATADIDTTQFTVARLTTQFLDLCAYIDTQRPARDLIRELAKHSGGFLHVNEEGKYTLKVMKANYATSDVNFTLQYMEIAAPFISNFEISRVPIDQISNDITIAHGYNHAREEFSREVNKTTNKGYNITASRIETAYTNKDTVADALAEYYAGDGATFGHFGEQKTIIKFKTLNPKWLFAQLGDIVSLSSAWTDAMRGIDAFGKSIDNLYFMITSKQGNHSSVVITMVEVGDAGITIAPDGPDYFHDLFFEDALT